jgi:hypothetical protein
MTSKRSVRALVIVLVAWLPLGLDALVRRIVGVPLSPLDFDISVHTRLLVAIPLVILASYVLERNIRITFEQLYDGHFVERRTLDAIAAHADRLRHSRVVDIILLAIAFLLGQSALWGLTGSGVVRGVDDPGELEFTRVWYTAIALPIGQFIHMRFLWSWLVWSLTVVRISRVPISTIAGHPDRSGGLGFLARPILAIVIFVIATSSTLAAAWGTHLVQTHVPVTTYAPMFLAFIFVNIAIACGPLLAYIPVLARMRLHGLARYNDLGVEYARAFWRKWLEGRPHDGSVLGTSDIQSLADLGNSLDSVERTRFVPFSLKVIPQIVLAAAIPMLPLLLSNTSASKLLGMVLKLMTGGA